MGASMTNLQYPGWLPKAALLVTTWIASSSPAQLPAQKIRVATFNVSLFRSNAEQLVRELDKRDSQQPQQIAEILQIVRPDIVLLNEVDFDREGKAVRRFQQNYLEVPQNGRKAIHYEHTFIPQVNTGIPSSLDLDNDGKTNGPGDAFGYGKFPGQYGLVVLSKYRIDSRRTRTFQKFLWKDMPGALLPRQADDQPYYSPEETSRFRLSSKNHCDVVIRLTPTTDFHFLVSHPTPPVFDREEDRNGRRNHDEIRFWNDYISPSRSKYVYDDQGVRGGLAGDSLFVIAGDLNADPHDGDSTNQPIRKFQENRRVNFEVKPKSSGALEASRSGKANRDQRGDPALDTADFNDNTVGNLRIDYVLPSKGWHVHSSGVFWPESGNPDSRLLKASDHRLVWVDLESEKGDR